MDLLSLLNKVYSDFEELEKTLIMDGKCCRPGLRDYSNRLAQVVAATIS